VSQIIVLVGFGVALLLFHRILAELIRPGWAPIVLTLLFAASVVNVGVTQWWASGMDRIPATIGSFISILGYLRYHKTGSKKWLALSLAALGLSFLFYIKPVFVPLYLVLIRVLLLEPERSLKDTIAGALEEWRTWLLYFAITAVFGFVYVKLY